MDTKPDDTNIWRRTRGGQGRDTETRRDPRRANLPGANRDLVAGRGRKRGERTSTVNGGRSRHAERGAGTSGGGWRVAGAGNVQMVSALHRERRCGAGVNERSLTMKVCGWGGGRKEGGKNNPENDRRQI